MSLLAERRRTAAVGRRAPVAAGAVLVALATTVVAVVASGARPRPAGGGLRDAGQLTGWLLPLCRVLLDVAALACVGALLAASLLVAADAARLRMLHVARRCSVLWLLAAVGMAMVSASALLGVSLLATVRSPSSYRLLVDLPQGRALLVIALAAAGIRWWAGRASSLVAARTLLVLSLLAMAPMLQTGHAATGSHHYLATQVLLLHVLGATLWVGGLLMILLHLRGTALVEALPSFSRVALGCFVTVCLSGAAGAWLRLGTEPEAWRTSYGALVGAKVVLLAAWVPPVGGTGTGPSRLSLAGSGWRSPGWPPSRSSSWPRPRGSPWRWPGRRCRPPRPPASARRTRRRSPPWTARCPPRRWSRC